MIDGVRGSVGGFGLGVSGGVSMNRHLVLQKPLSGSNVNAFGLTWMILSQRAGSEQERRVFFFLKVFKLN
jgi:hypothetical protein